MKSLFQDMRQNRASDDPEVPGLAGVLSTFLTLRFLAVFLYRFSRALGVKQPMMGSIVKQVNHLITGADIAWQSEIGCGLVLWHPTGVVIGPGTVLGRRCSLQQGVTLGNARSRTSPRGEPFLEDDVYVGAGARVLGGLKVASGARIGANAVVLQSVPAGYNAVGIPARLVPAHRG